MTGGESLTVLRGDTDRYGNPEKVASGTIKGVFAWGVSRPGGFPRSDGNTQVAELYVARGTDLRARDRVQRANGEQYAVVRGAWDQDFPFDGYDFGVMVFQVVAING